MCCEKKKIFNMKGFVCHYNDPKKSLQKINYFNEYFSYNHIISIGIFLFFNIFFKLKNCSIIINNIV